MNFNDFALIPKADYKDACDAIREKTDKTDDIVSGEMGDLIRGITSGGMTASIFATGLTETDTVTASYGDKTKVAVWNSTESRHEITGIGDKGMWTVTATNGEDITTQDVLVDAAMEYEIEMSIVRKLWLYREGDECEEVTGGWSFVASSSSKATLTKNNNNMLIHVDSGYYNCAAYIEDMIDLTPYSKLHTDGSFVTGTGGDAKGPYFRVARSSVKPTASTSIQNTTNDLAVITDIPWNTYTATSGTVGGKNQSTDAIEYDVSGITGLCYLRLMGICGVLNLTYKNIWLE